MKSSLKVWWQKTKVKLIAGYFGHPEKKVKIICITGSTGKATVARFVHEITRAAEIKAAVLASDGRIKPSVMYKFLSDAAQTGVSHVIITASSEALKEHVLDNVPVYMAVMTDLAPAASVVGYEIPFQAAPKIVVLNRDDEHYKDFAQFKGSKDTLTFGVNLESDVKIDNFALYKKGSEANLIFGTKNFTTACFIGKEEAVVQMATAATVGIALNIATGVIIEGIANFES